MSLGGTIGAVAGGVLGFFIGGPVGAAIGMGLGAGAGTLLDPIAADTQTIGSPKPETAVMSSKIGDPCPDLCGTAKITGQLLAYGGERSEAVYSTPTGSGGKGGPPEPEPQVTGHNYFMSWVLGFCVGPVNTLYSIYKNEEELIWEGKLPRPSTGGHETIVIDGFGTIEFYFGTNDQAVNSKVAALIPDSTLNTPYRNYCWCLLDDCFIGTYPRTPTISIVVKKLPADLSFSSQVEIQEFDCNPMHAIQYILTGLGQLPISWLDGPDFSEMAYTLSSENRGISLLLSNQQSALSYLQSINSHIDNILKFGADGKFRPKLIRDDYDITTLPIIDESILLEEPTFSRPSWIDTVNEVKVQYSEIPIERENEPVGRIHITGLNGFYRPFTDSAWEEWHSFTDISDTTGWDEPNIKKVFQTRNQCTFVKKADDTFWCRGYNTHGPLGVGSSADNLSWTQLPELSPAGYRWDYFHSVYLYSVAIDVAGNLFAAGDIEYMNPFPSGDQTSWVQEESGQLFDNALVGLDWMFLAKSRTTFPNLWYPTTSDPTLAPNTLVGTGNNVHGQLGFPGTGGAVPNGTSESWSALEIPGNTVCGFQSLDNAFMLQVGSEDNFEIYSAGLNAYGALGLPDTGTQYREWTLVPGGPWSKLSASAAHAVALKPDGTLWATGYNFYGQIGQGDYVDRYGFVQIGTSDDWVQISGGTRNTVALNSKGELWSCGDNDYGQVGVASLYNQKVANMVREDTESTWLSIQSHVAGTIAIK